MCYSQSQCKTDVCRIFLLHANATRSIILLDIRSTPSLPAASLRAGIANYGVHGVFSYASIHTKIEPKLVVLPQKTIKKLIPIRTQF